MKLINIPLATIAICGACSLHAATLTVTPGDPSWGNPPGENLGGGSSAITSTAPRSGNGSVELFGDRTRFVGLGDFYNPASNLGLLSNLSSVTFDWNIALGSTNPYNPDYTPALRIHIWDGSQRSELIWEGAYQPGVYGPTTNGTWYTSGAGDYFWQYVAGVGPTLVYNRTVTDWKSLYGSGAYVSAISVGVGGGASSNYHAFADNITVTFGNTSTTYNFEVQSASVPDGGSTAVLLGLGALGLVALARRRKIA